MCVCVCVKITIYNYLELFILPLSFLLGNVHFLFFITVMYNFIFFNFQSMVMNECVMEIPFSSVTRYNFLLFMLLDMYMCVCLSVSLLCIHNVLWLFCIKIMTTCWSVKCMCTCEQVINFFYCFVHLLLLLKMLIF